MQILLRLLMSFGNSKLQARWQSGTLSNCGIVIFRAMIRKFPFRISSQIFQRVATLLTGQMFALSVNCKQRRPSGIFLFANW